MAVRFETSAPWTVLFGPSGSGKSTILRVVAGLERVGEGKGGTQRTGRKGDAEDAEVRIGGRVVEDSRQHVCVRADERPVRWVGQRAYLFPWMTVEENLRFGAGDKSTAEIATAIEMFQLDTLRGKRPGELSGGQAQRVAVARAAIGAEGKLLLLDEPFAGLDAKVRDRLIASLRSWLGETPVVSVTHDVGEAFLLRAEVVRIADGRVVAQGPVAEVLAEERKRLLAVLG